ncbi:MAG: hypothetical protein Q4C03_06310 [bacterium]|nr:hypothetical protein [bacterium]
MKFQILIQKLLMLTCCISLFSCTHRNKNGAYKSEVVQIPTYPEAEPFEIPLSTEERCLLAQYIVQSYDWERATKEEFRLRKDPVLLGELPSCDLEAEDSYLHRVIIPYVHKNGKDSEQVRRMMVTLKGLAPCSDLLSFVIDYYVKKYPDSYDGWAFLWHFAGMQEEELPHCETITSGIVDKKLDQSYYGKQMLHLLEGKCYRPNDGKVLKRTNISRPRD